MATKTLRQIGNHNETVEKSHEPADRLAVHGHERDHDKSVARSVTTEPQSQTLSIVAVGATVPLGLGITALATSYLTSDKQVALTAWIAVAVVGTASVISAAAVSHRRTVTVDKERQDFRGADHARGRLNHEDNGAEEV